METQYVCGFRTLSKSLRIGGLLTLLSLPGMAQAQGVSIQVNAGANRHPINPYIYGVAHATSAELIELNAPFNRSGGNATSRYNWQANAANRGRDWYFESLPYASAQPGAEVDAFIASTRAANAEPSVTVPMVGWVAKLGLLRLRLASFSILKYGWQTGLDSWFSDAGTGVLGNGQFVLNDPNDANMPSTPGFQKGWVQHLRERWGQASQGGVRIYTLDNEPSIWHENHRDVHSAGATMQEVRDKHLTYAAMVKDTEPGAVVMGPEEWGWGGYLYSGHDIQAAAQNGYTRYPDREAHGGWDYLPWLLDQFRQNEQATGRRLLDVFTVHYYPQGGEFSTDTSSSMQLRRNRSTRSLWDPSYTDESWIQNKVMLVPRLKNWVATYYPGTKTGITEYNWGAEDHINGATAQADILGIFGREGLDYANRWETPKAATPTFKAMKLYRNYDNQRSTFGDVSVACAVPNPDSLSAFAAQRTSDGALTIMVINKVASSGTPVTLNLSGFTAGGPVQRWQLTSANTISRLGDLSASATTVSATVPGQSVTLFIVPSGGTSGGGTNPNPNPGPPVNRPPLAHILATATLGSAPLAASFNGLESEDIDGTIVDYSWNFGDGQVETGPLVNHLYAQPGTYTVKLTVTDNGGSTASATEVVSVASGIPPASGPATLVAPGGFYAQASGASITLAWTDTSQYEDGFIIERAVETWPVIYVEAGRTAPNATSFVDRPLPGNYMYRVRAFQGSLFSDYSNQDSAQAK